MVARLACSTNHWSCCAGYVGNNDGTAVPAYGLPLGQAQQMQLQFMKDQLRQELQQRSFLSHAQVHLHFSLYTVTNAHLLQFSTFTTCVSVRFWYKSIAAAGIAPPTAVQVLLVGQLHVCVAPTHADRKSLACMQEINRDCAGCQVHAI